MNDIVYVEGWKEIGVLLKKAARTCRNWAKREHDPLPVFRVGGVIRLNADDYKTWLERQKATHYTPHAGNVVGAQIVNGATVCPHCGQVKAKPRHLRAV